MTNDIWYGASGDWDYGQNWSSGTTPLADQPATLAGQAPETISGSGYFDTMEIAAAALTLSGDFEGFDGTATIADTIGGQSSGTMLAQQTMKVSPSGIVVAGQIDLTHTSLLIEGALLVTGGALQAVTVSGTEGFLGAGSVISVASLSVVAGALANGDVSFGTGGALNVDDQSSLGTGTFSTTGSTTVAVQNTSGLSAYSFSNEFDTLMNGSFTFSSVPAEALSLDGGIAGTGTLTFENQAVSVADTSGFAGTLNLTSSTMLIENEASSGPITFILNESSLTLPKYGTAQAEPAYVMCNGASDTVEAGAAAVKVSNTGTATLSFTGGLGAATVQGGAGSLEVISGPGDTLVRCGAGSNSVTVGGGSDAVYGSSGANITVINGGSVTVTAGAGSEMTDATASTGNNDFVGGSGGGTTTIRGGAGSSVVFGEQGAIYAIGGTGNFIVSGGTSGQDTLTGGSGANTLFARSAGTQVHGLGAGPNLLVATTGGVNLDASHTSGEATLFSAGGAGGVTTLIGGSGSDVIANPNGNAVVQGGSGNELIWGGTSTADTINGGTGNTTIVGGAGSQIQLNGSANDTVLAYGGNATISAANFSGKSVIFADGNGLTNVVCGAGSDTIVSGSGTLHAVGGSGFNAIWGGNSGHDTIIGGSATNALFGQSGAYLQAAAGSTDYMQAAGSNVTLNGGGSAGWESLMDTEGSSGTVMYTGQGVSEVQTSGASAAIHVVGGQVSLLCGAGVDTIWLDAPSIAGTLNIFGFDPSKDQISAAGSPTGVLASPAIMVGGSNETLNFGSETIILHGSFASGP